MSTCIGKIMLQRRNGEQKIMTEWQSLTDSEKQRIITSGTDEEKHRHHETVCKMSGNSLKSLDLELVMLYSCNYKPPSGLNQGAKWGIVIGVVLLFVGLYAYWWKGKK